MKRSFFAAVAISLMVIGAESFVVDEVQWRRQKKAEGFTTTETGGSFQPPEHFPWVMLAAGAVVGLWTITISNKAASAKKHSIFVPADKH